MYKATDQVAVVGVIDPDANAAGTVYSDYVNMEYFEEVLGIGLAGTFGTSGTLDFSLVQATSATGASVKAITGKAATQLTHAATENDLQAVINLKAADLDSANSFSFVALKMVTAVATGDSGGVLLGIKPKHGPANAHDVASVTEIV